MRHAVLGTGGVGAFLGAALARAGRDVLLLMREESLARYDGTVHVESALLGHFDAELLAAATLERPVDVLWVTTKATQLADAIERVPAADGMVVVPLLNGLDHVELLRRHFGRVSAATITIESERVRPGVVRQLSMFALVELSPGPDAESLRGELDAAGLTASIGASEAAVLWRKLALLAPIALTTTLRGSALDGVVADTAWRDRLRGCVREVAAVAHADGVVLDAEALIAGIESVPPGMRSSMQKDREAGRPTEIDAIGGAVLRAAKRHGLEAPTTQELVDGIRAGEPSKAREPANPPGLAGLSGCYWVEPGRFLAGAYPHRSDTIARLRTLGVTLFLDLTEPGEYGSLPYDGVLGDGVRAVRKPLRDYTAPPRDEMREILDLIDSELAAGGVVYLHCYGGIGRTGTVVGCYLVRHGTPPDDASEAIGRLRANTENADRPSPESEEQRALVETWRG